MISAHELVEKIKKYHASFDEDLVIKAYQLAEKSHSNQFRSSGEPYFIHPVAVAEILTQYKLDYQSIITALLHDTVEDTDVTLEDIENQFGEKIASLVDGVTKLGKIKAMPSGQKTAENFRKLVMAMSQDIRVLIVKLADRSHNMETINFIKSEERRVRIANESLTIYAPLAARIGMYKIRDDLQELSFAQVNPEARSYIVKNLKDLQKSEKNIISKIITDLKDKISASKIEFDISGREKKPFSIWNKMKNCNVGFGHLHDIMAFRIITTDIANCYRVLGIINSNYNMIPGSFKDYISTPKENNYQSLHFSSLGPQNKKIEIQIRTQEMHKTAEMGIAAHWSYKEKGNNEEGKKYEWMRELITLFEQADSSEVMRDYNIDMHNDQVFCFTPSGDIFNLPIGASIVDFAYAIHSEVGNSCISAKINGSTMPLNHRLNNGDQVEIMTDKESNPSPNWMQFVTTSKARASIRNFIRSKKRSEYIALGRAILNKFFAANNLEINEKLLEGILPNFNKKSIDDLYTFVAEGLVSRNEILKAVYPDQQKEAIVKKDQNATEREDWFAKIPNINSIPVEGLIYGMAINFAACCNPIPGDNITGVINTGSGVTIHNKTCLTLKSIALNPQKLVDICWRAGNDLDFYQSRIMVVMRNASGSLAEVSSNIARQKININNIKINNRANDFFEVIIDINVKNTDHLEEIMSTLRMSKTIVEVHRFY